MSNLQALTTCRMTVPGADWCIDVSATCPAIPRMHAVFPDGTKASFVFANPRKGGGTLASQVTALSKQAAKVAEAWAAGVLS